MESCVKSLWGPRQAAWFMLWQLKWDKRLLGISMATFRQLSTTGSSSKDTASVLETVLQMQRHMKLSSQPLRNPRFVLEISIIIQ